MGELNFRYGGECVEPCPECGNRTDFKARSSQCAEDACEIWVECECGYDPTAENSLLRLEDVWGTLNKWSCITALECWNDAIHLDNRGRRVMNEQEKI